jgi:effector-binding domain-containing protein
MKKYRKMLRKIKYTFLFIIVGALVFVGYFMSLNNSYSVTRERLIKAPANLVYLQIADLKNWDKWSQFKEKDSTMQFEFQESTNKEGDFFRFTDMNGIRQKLTNLTLAADSLIVQSLSSNEQMQEFKWQIIPQENGVLLRWTSEGELPFMQRIYSKQMNDMIGPQLTRGLELLDKSVLADMQKHETTIDKITELSSTYYLYKSASCKFDNLGKKMDELLPIVLMYVINNHIEMNGKPFTIYNKRDVDNNSVIFSSCMPTKEKITVKDDILTGQTPGGKYLKIIFQGDYKYLAEAWHKANDFVATNDSLIVDATRSSFEVYSKGHTKSLNPADWITELYIPVIEIINKENLPQ